MRRQKEGGAQGSRAASFRAEIPGRQQRGRATEKQAPPAWLPDIGPEFSRRGKRKNGGIYSRKKFGLFRTLLYVILIKSRAAGQARSVLFILVSSIPRRTSVDQAGVLFIADCSSGRAAHHGGRGEQRRQTRPHTRKAAGLRRRAHNKEMRHPGHTRPKGCRIHEAAQRGALPFDKGEGVPLLVPENNKIRRETAQPRGAEAAE